METQANLHLLNTAPQFEEPNPQVTSGGVVSKGFHFPGFALINDGNDQTNPPKTGIFPDSPPNIVAYGLQSQGSSARLRPSMRVGADFSAFSLRTIMFGCIEDTAGRSNSLPAVNCGVTLTCVAPGGARGGSQTLQYQYGGVTNAMFQAADLDIDTFKCCERVEFSTDATAAGSQHTVATVIDTVSMYVTAKKTMSSLGSGGQQFCGCT